MSLQGTVATGEYLVYEGGDMAEALDANRHLLRKLPVVRRNWLAEHGDSEITVSSQGAAPYLRLQLKPLGKSFEIPDPSAKAQQTYDQIVK